MIPESLRTFVFRLRKETEAGTISWLPGAEDSYFCNRNEFTVYLNSSFDEERQLSFYRMTLTSGAREAGFVVHGEEDDVQEMRDLYSSASLSAGGFGNIMDRFF